jgi:hypothetical protein
VRLKASVLLVAIGIVAVSFWWRSREGPSPILPVGAQSVQLAGPSGASSLRMARAFLRDPPPPIPRADLSLCTDLSEAARARLAEQGFVVVPLRGSRVLSSAYGGIKASRRPILVTTDAALHVSHLVFDWHLRFLETAHLHGDLVNLTDALLAKMMGFADAASTPDLRAAALDCASYLSVGKRLLVGGDTQGAPEDLARKIAEEIRLIEAAQGFARSPLFGYQEDYSQYKPRGHYARSEQFQRYFRAMTWYGRMRFLVQPAERSTTAGGLGAEAVDHQTREALLLCKALREARVKGETAEAVWARIYRTTQLFAGPSDDLTFEDFAGALDAVYGKELPLKSLADSGKLTAFQAKAAALRPPRILSTYSLDSGSEQAWRSETQGLAFLGQRFALDSLVLQQLTFGNVRAYMGPAPPPPITAVSTAGGVVRGFPLGLDLLSAFGSPEAQELIRNGSDDRYEGYADHLQDMRGQLAAVSQESWASDLYVSRLDAIRRCLADPPSAAPAFMQRKEYLLKQHQTALGAWAELRHDTIVYTKQPYGAAQSALAGVSKGGPVEEPKVVRGYVEPCPDLYRSIAEGFARAIQLLSDAGYPDDRGLAGNLQECANLLNRLAAISDKELAGTDLAEQEYEFVESIGGWFSGLLRFPHYWDVTEEFQTEADKQMPIVADVFTNVDAREVLEEAVGEPLTILAICPVAGTPTVCRGITYSYYEFRQPMGSRLTDDEWREMLNQGVPAGRPAWTDAFIVEASPARVQQSGG